MPAPFIQAQSKIIDDENDILRSGLPKIQDINLSRQKLGRLDFRKSPNLKNILIMQMPNLYHVDVRGCNNIEVINISKEYVFTTNESVKK